MTVIIAMSLCVGVSYAEQDIPVQDIEVGEYKADIMIGDTVDLTAQVLPENATEQIITYRSSDVGVATVDSKGQIKGIGRGDVTIVLSAGEVEKGLKINVLGAKTTSIAPNKEYVVLKPGGTFKMSAKVEPSDAIQKLTFRSWDSNVATVSDGGILKAVGIGSTFVIVSNGDMTASVSVIVNKDSAAVSRGSGSDSLADGVGSLGADTVATVATDTDTTTTTLSAADADVLSAIAIDKPGASSVVRQEELPVVTSAVLKALSDNDASLTIVAREYSVKIDGFDIVNPANEFATLIDFAIEENGLGFVLNGGRNMPGRVVLEIKDWIAGRARNDTGGGIGASGGIDDDAGIGAGGGNDAGFRYLYLYNDSSGKYQRLSVDVQSALVLDDSGKYLLSSEKLGVLTLKMKWVIGAGVLILIGVAAFIFIRKKYWFW
jgi:hypothetical protein